MKNDKLWRSKKKARKLRKSRPGTLRRGTFELPEGRCELTGRSEDAPGVLRRPLGDAPERLGELSVSSREPPGLSTIIRVPSPVPQNFAILDFSCSQIWPKF